ncbi:hypothetical protein MRX96_001745 [Rhipicephalus microplus]
MEIRKPFAQVIDGVPRCAGIIPDMLRENLKFRAQGGRRGAVNFSQEWNTLDDVHRSIDCKKGIFATHLPLTKDIITKEGRYIYVARNPWDVCVSMYHMVTNLSSYGYQDATFDDFVRVFVSGNFGYGDYFEHVASAYHLRQEPNVLFVTYEEMKKNTCSVVLKVAHFLGEHYLRALEGDERVTCKEGFEGDETKYGIVRKAKVGSWKEHFTPELLRCMEARIIEAEKATSFMDLWKDVRAEALKLSQKNG